MWVKFDRFLSGRAQDDPFYLSNRTFTEKMKGWVLIGLPCLLAIGLIAFALAPRGAKDVRSPEPTSAQVAAKMLPDFSKTVYYGDNRAVIVDEVQIEHSDPRRLILVARNNSEHIVHSADFVCELLNAKGGRLGAVTAQVGEIAPHGTARFETEIAQDTAYSALVREMHVH
jgi:hypothetical protein